MIALALALLAAPLQVEVIVPLCDGAALQCGRGGLGDPRSVTTNLYWGAMYGAERYLSRADGFSVRASKDLASAGALREVELVRAAKRGEAEVHVRLRAFAGDAIDAALAHFLAAAAAPEGPDLLVWAGHNRLMDVPAPALAPAQSGRRVAVLACNSAPYFRDLLAGLGATPVALTRSFMAPEAYLLEALVESAARGELDDRQRVRERLIAAYARYQRITPKAAASVFWRP